MAVFWAVAPCSLAEPYNLEDSHLRTHRRENLKYNIINITIYFQVTSKQET
jgi:hypothetical protein